MSSSHSRSFLIEREEAQSRRNQNNCYNNTCQQPESCCNQKPCKDEKQKWNALDPSACHPFDEDATVGQDKDATIGNIQQSIESIIIKDSCDVDVTTTDIQAALNVQLVLQVAISLVISISIADSSKADTITQDLNAKLQTSQINKQQVYIENSRGVNVFTTDTDLAVNIQLLLQVLVALVAKLDVL
ncbi:spore coat protein X [Virgibacillus halotolerans]|uniref:spore coat protein n=1 Tax=Virgibacillus halotolerans TaxID=1071053 RepID=UPI0019615A0F|nr:spore coat protein [Virgibacillus halotolerans]MBM7599733.1 spore coat protein X [Virgibacillus halotolerans]